MQKWIRFCITLKNFGNPRSSAWVAEILVSIGETRADDSQRLDFPRLEIPCLRRRRTLVILLPMESLTDRQRAILDFIRDHLAANGFPPTQTEIAATFDIQLRGAQKHLEALHRKHAIEVMAGKSRGIRILEPARPSIRQDAYWDLPLVGRVAAGQPIESDAHIERRLSVDRHLFRPRPHYLLRVEGDSMSGVGIMNRDLIAVHRSPDATNGQIVVARIDGEITVKRFRQIRQHILLLPENPAFEPIEVDPRTDDFAIEGLYVGSIRIP